MRTFTILALIVTATLTAIAQQEPTFRATTQIVSVPTTVTDAQGRLVPNLEQDQFSILDNGKPQQITFFQNETQPFTAVVMLDFSGSMTANLEFLRRATEQFLLRMLPKDKGMVGAFRPDAALGRGGSEYRHAEAGRRTQDRPRLHRR